MGKRIFIGTLITALVVLCLIPICTAQTGFFVGNIVPELIGVCIELLIIVFIFDAWQRKEEKRKDVIIERRLREFLIFFLKQNFEEFPSSNKIGDFYGKDHAKNQDAVSGIISDIGTQGVSEIFVSNIQRYCENQKDIFNNLIPVASELTNDHFKSWVRISYFMNAIASKNEKTSHAVLKILEHVQRFDAESFKNKLYVDAK